MKKLTEFIAAVVAVCALTLCLTFSACAKNGDPEPGDGTGNYIAKSTETEIVFVGTTEVLKEKDGYSVYDYLRALSLKNQLTFEGRNGKFGYYVTSVNGKSETVGTNSGSSWTLYISFKTLEGDDAVYAGGDYTTEYVYGNTTLYSAIYGVSGVPYVSGATYALVLQSWSF